MKILVTGASGFVGRALCSHLINEGREIRAAVRQPSSISHTVVVSDICSNTSWTTALRNVDTVIHLAARVHMMNDTVENPLAAFRRINLDGTLNLARQAAEKGVKRFIFLSSVKVHGEETFPHHDLAGKQGERSCAFTEHDLPQPQDAYAVSKFEAEEALRSLAKETGLEVVIIRSPLVYGPGVKGNFATMMHWIKKGIPLPFGSIHNQRSLIALDNLVDFITTCIDHPDASNQIFLISDGEDISTTELLLRVGQVTDTPARLIPVSAGLLRFGASMIGKKELIQRLCGNLQVDISKAREVLGWEPVVSVDEGLRRVVEQ